MATAYKVAQAQGTASVSTYATLYNSPASTEAIISTIAICNTAATAATYRIGIMDSAGSPTSVNWLVYDATVPAKDTTALTFGVCLQASKYIRISSSANTVTFTAFLSEIS